MKGAIWVAAIAALLIAALWATMALSQHNHAAGHRDYLNWSSQKTGNCCSNQDCGALDVSEWKETTGGAEILIDDYWCPVRQEHYIVHGKSPDWTQAHACVRKRGIQSPLTESPCDRLLCFVGIPRG